MILHCAPGNRTGLPSPNVKEEKLRTQIRQRVSYPPHNVRMHIILCTSVRSSPLAGAVLAPSSQNRLPARKVGWTEDATEKLICHMLINALPDAHEQDVCRFHANIWLLGCMFHKALLSDQPNDQFAIATRSNSQPFDVPVPR